MVLACPKCASQITLVGGDVHVDRLKSVHCNTCGNDFDAPKSSDDSGITADAIAPLKSKDGASLELLSPENAAAELKKHTHRSPVSAPKLPRYAPKKIGSYEILSEL